MDTTKTWQNIINTYGSFVLLLGITILLSVQTVDVLKKMFDQRFTWNLLDSTNKRLSRATYSESSLYFTFLEEYTQAPTLFSAIAGVLRDNKTEYPEVINAISRFNIWQEIIVGQLWRSGLKKYFVDPLDLIIESVWVLQATSFVGMALLAWNLGGSNVLSISCSFVALGTYAHIASTEKLNCFRAVQFPLLRENFSVPFMWYQLIAVCGIIKRSSTASSVVKRSQSMVERAILFITTTLVLLGWQFAPFLLLLQVGALLATYIVGYITFDTLAFICKILVYALLFVGVILTMGNVMLLTAPVLFLSIIIIVTASQKKFKTEKPKMSTTNSYFTSLCSGIRTVLQRLTLVLALVGTAFVVKFIIMSLVGLQDDAHIMNILKFKLSGFAAKYEDFQTLLYVCSGAYQIMKSQDFIFLQDREQLPARFVIAVGTVFIGICLELHRKTPLQKKLDSGLVFAAANGILLTALFSLIQRLSSVGIPFVCILVAQLASPNHMYSCINLISDRISDIFHAEKASSSSEGDKIVSASGKQKGDLKPKANKKSTGSENAKRMPMNNAFSSHKIFRWALMGIGIAISMWCSQKAFDSFHSAYSTILPKIRAPDRAMISKDMQAAKNLMHFVQESLPVDAALGGDAPILSRIRLMTHRPILNHPHAEHKARRVREEQLYQVFNRWTEYEVWLQLRKLKADYFVFSLGPCDLKCQLPDGRRFDMVYLVNSTNSLGEPGKGRKDVEQFCFWVYTQQLFLTYFDMVHDGMPFWVIKVLSPEEAKIKGDKLKRRRATKRRHN